MSDQEPGISSGAVVGIVILLILAVVAFFMSFTIVSPGYVGVPVILGHVQKDTLGQGIHMKWPFVEGVVKMDTRVQKEQVDADAATSDLQDVTTSIAVNYHVAPGTASALYQTIGRDYKDVVIAPAIQEQVKAVTADYDAQDLIAKRPAVSAAMEQQIAAELQPDGIAVDTVSIVNMNFSKAFNDAIEAKQVAQQQVQQAQLQLQQAQINAQQQVAIANAQASATVATAKANATAMELQQQQLTPQMVQYQAIQKWDGHLPQVMSPNAAVPFVGSATGSGETSSTGTK